MKVFLKIIGLLVAVGIVAAGFVGHNVHQTITEVLTVPANEASTEFVRFRIDPGMTRNQIIEELASLGLIANAARVNEADRNQRIGNRLGIGYFLGWEALDWSRVQAGEYELSPSLSLSEMVQMFVNGDIASARHRITIREGERMTGIANDFAPVAGLSAEELLATWDDPEFVRPFIDEFWFLTDEILNEELFHPFEGYFRPLTYEFMEEFYTVEDITRTLLNETNREFDAIRQDIETSGYTVQELLAFAAIIQWEAANTEEMNDIAGVFYNRLRDGWRLQSDVGAQYIAEERQVHVTFDMIGVQSGFNTYMIYGLPIGAVSSPSMPAILAALNPTAHGYFFFIGDLFQCIDGKTHFFTNYPDHLAFQQRYLQPGYDAGHAVCPPTP